MYLEITKLPSYLLGWSTGRNQKRRKKPPQKQKNKHIKICSISLVIGEMQIKTLMKCYFMFTKMGHFKIENKCWQGCEEIGIAYGVLMV